MSSSLPQYVQEIKRAALCHSSTLAPEICYNLPYMARNGRPTGNPWSQRQMGVYQQFFRDGRRAWWIFLQTLPGLCKQLRELLHVQPSDDASWNAYRHPMLLHLRILLIAAREWHSYIDDLENQHSVIVSKTLCSIHTSPATVRRCQNTAAYMSYAGCNPLRKSRS